MAVATDPVPAWLDEALDRAGGSADVGGERDRLRSQLGFLLELDNAKQVLRRTYVTDGSRRENDAEHMWHAMIAGIVLAEHSAEPVDPLRLACMLAVHDIVEIDAGDTFVYDASGRADTVARERAAAERIFGLLPDDQAEQFRSLWDEFELKATPTARMAGAIDRLLPVLMNRAVGGRTWAEHGITAGQVMSVNSSIADGSPVLFEVVRHLLDDAERDGILRAD